ncbi:MAG: hypothetical protein ACLR8P_02865 [Clostridium fessum]
MGGVDLELYLLHNRDQYLGCRRGRKFGELMEKATGGKVKVRCLRSTIS